MELSTLSYFSAQLHQLGHSFQRSVDAEHAAHLRDAVWPEVLQWMSELELVTIEHINSCHVSTAYACVRTKPLLTACALFV
jgi:hypothetical protein